MQLFKSYIDLELRLREFDRCRTLYQKWLEVRRSPTVASPKLTLSAPPVRRLERFRLDQVGRA